MKSAHFCKNAFSRKESAADLLKCLCSGGSFAPAEAWEHFLLKSAPFCKSRVISGTFNKIVQFQLKKAQFGSGGGKA